MQVTTSSTLLSQDRLHPRESAKALTHVVLSWRDDTTLQVRGMFHGFDIPSKGKVAISFNPEDDRLPEMFIRGAGMYPAHLNPENTVGTVQASSMRCDRWRELPLNNRSAPVTSRRRSPITRPKRTGRFRMKRASKNCLCVRNKSMPCWTSTRTSDR